MHMLSTYIFLWLQCLEVFELYFFVESRKQSRKRNSRNQRLFNRKSTYFVFHSHKTQKVMSTFFIPCFVGAFSGVVIAAPPQL